ncbi:MAG: endonuclease/exonuclease/phosphatase family protein [Actinomycetota bacterium]
MTGDESAQIRVLSYNVLSLRMSEQAVAAIIKACDPDIVCVQEAPRFLFWRRRIERLAAASGLRFVAGHRRAGAVAVLVGPRIELVEAGVTRLPWRVGRHRRGVACALVGVLGRRLVVASVHLSLHADERLAHLPLIVAAVERYAVPVVIAGDINEEDIGAAWLELGRRYQDAYAVAPVGHGETFSALHPRRRIDAIFVDRSVTVLSCQVPDLPEVAAASDHCPLLATLAF